MINIPNLIKTKYGSYQFEKMPSTEELSSFYSNKYYQNGYGNYSFNYDKDEIKHKSFINSLIAKKALDLNPAAKNIFDVGCGEGYLLAEFKKLGLEVKGTDFSQSGISNANQDLLEVFIQGDLYAITEKELKTQKFDIITNTNVIEHVINPEELINVLKTGMKETSILSIKAPNDFSALHKKLIKDNLVNEKWWINYPEHLSYFNKDAMTELLENNGLDIISILAEFPIDLFLLNEDLNYIKDKNKGVIAQKQRVKTDLFFSELNINKVIKLYEAYADLGIGRSLTYFCRLK